MQGPEDPIPEGDRSPSSPDSRLQAKVLHDVRGLLSPALLSADRLSQHADPKVRELAEQIILSVEQAARRLKDLPPR